MIFLEMFSGSKTISKAFENVGFEVYNIDYEEEYEPTLCADIMEISYEDIELHIGSMPDVIWASPDCTKFSFASGEKNEFRKSNTKPLSREARRAIFLVKQTLLHIKLLNPTYWFLENPLHGALKNMDFMKEYSYVDVAYCRYGSLNQKATRIWGKFPPSFRPKSHCYHIKHQLELKDIAGAHNRAIMPIELGHDLAESCALDNGLQIMTLKEWI